MADLKLLIIDDDADQRFLTREVLEDKFGKGCVTEAATGTAALAIDLSAFDMILSDYNLPDCTGLELLDLIRGRCRTPVIMVTGENVSAFAAEAIKRGATDYVVKVNDYFFTIPLVVEKNLTMAKLVGDNERLRADLERSLAEVKASHEQLEQALKKIEEVAATDPLTGLYNRRHLGRVLDQLFAEGQRYRTDLACVMVDLDGYKQLNDSQGHQMGDRLLTLVGDIFRGLMRRADVAARYGGDEFVLLLPHCDSTEAAKLVARVRDEYRRRSAELTGKPMSMSVGVASAMANAPATADALVATADAALYQSKANGRDRVTIATESKRLAAAG